MAAAYPDFSNTAWSAVMRKVAFEARKTLKSMNKPAIAGGVSADTMFKQGSVMRLRISGYTKAAYPDFDEFTWRSVIYDLAFKARRMLKKQGGSPLPPLPCVIPA